MCVQKKALTFIYTWIYVTLLRLKHLVQFGSVQLAPDPFPINFFLKFFLERIQQFTANMEAPKEPLFCQHAHCTKARNKGKPFKRIADMNRHQKSRKMHACDPECCDLCRKLGDKRTHGVAGHLECSHLRCAERFSSEFTKRRHESEVSHECPPGCTTCSIAAALQKRKELEKQERKRRREEYAAQEKERFLKSGLVEKVATSIDWEAVAKKAEKSDTPEEVWLREEAEAFLKTLYKEDSIDACLARVLDTSTETIVAARIAKQTETPATTLSPPALEALLAYKDTMTISDTDWEITVRTFHLGKYATITQMTKLRKKQNKRFGIRRTPGNRGAFIPLIPYLKTVLEREQPSNEEPVDLKIALDNGQLSTNGKVSDLLYLVL